MEKEEQEKVKIKKKNIFQQLAEDSIKPQNLSKNLFKSSLIRNLAESGMRNRQKQIETKNERMILDRLETTNSIGTAIGGSEC
ncbi:hypothetical protein B9Z55_022569 [Caenorhabditis nigoni]|uniref:Uncharacterized protein n=1 Tax=Caenorhabditis nigoni TaxID=1611254 RepID=A0A2G5SL02_9PELO|nr:hypothetical protein B9Z55_022569 [Caenorhabditis nigoni]